MKRILMPLVAAFALATSANAGLTITEIMANPAGADEFGEWFEIYNTGSESINIEGYVFESGDTEYFIVYGENWVAPGQFFVLGCSGDLALNGGVEVDYVFNDHRFTLNNREDDIRIRDGWDGMILDTAQYTDPTRGRSTSLVNLFADNIEPSSWFVASVEMYGAENFGTPGRMNEDLLVLELSNVPATVLAGSLLEFDVAVTNPTERGISFDGWLNVWKSGVTDFNAMTFEAIAIEDEQTLATTLRMWVPAFATAGEYTLTVGLGDLNGQANFWGETFTVEVIR